MLTANAKKHQDALDYYEHRKATLADYLWRAFSAACWIVPVAFLLVVGVVIGGIRRALRRRRESACPSCSHPASKNDDSFLIPDRVRSLLT